MQAHGRDSARFRTAAHLAALVLYTCLAAVLTYPLPRYFARAIPGDGFDGWQNYWNLWWMKIALLVEHRSPYFSDIIYYPTGVDLHFHTLNPFNGLWTLPIQLVGGLMVAYNAVVLLSFVLGGYGAFLLARYAIHKAGLKGRGVFPAAFLGGVVYAFSPFHFAHLLGHMQVFSLEWLPFYALALWQATDIAASRSGRWVGHGVLAAIFLTLIGLCNWYYLFYSAILTAILFLWMLFRRRMSAAVLGSFALSTGGALLLLSPILIPMIRQAVGYRFMVPDPSQSRTFSADLLAFFTPNEFHPLWGETVRRWAGAHYTASLSEHLLFAGYVPMALAALAVALLWKKSAVRLWAISLATFFLLALGPVLHVAGRTKLVAGHEVPLPYALIYRLPFVRISRSVSRFDVMVMLALAVLAAVGVAFLLDRAGPRRAWAVAALAVGLTLFEFFPAPYPFSPPDTPAWYRTLAAEPGDFAVLNLPISFDRPGYLLYQTVHGKRLTVAYISREDPRTLVERAPVLQEFRHLGPDVLSHDVMKKAISVLRYLGVRYVVLDGYKMPVGEERKFTYGMAACVFVDEKPVYEDKRLRVYRVPDEGKEMPFLILGLNWGERESDRDRVWRVPPQKAEVIAVSEIPTSVRLHLKARGEGAVTITAPGLRWQSRLGNDVTTPEFRIPAGETRITLSFDKPPQVEGAWLERGSSQQ